MKKALKIIILIFIIILILFYLGFVFILPKVINSPYVINKAQNFIKNNFNLDIKTKNLRFFPHYNLSYDISADSIKIDDFLKIENVILNSKAFNIKPYSISAKYLFFDKTKLKENKTKKFNLNYLPMVDIKKADIILQNDKKYNSNIELNNILSRYEDKIYYIGFKGLINSNLLNEALILDSSELMIKNKELYLNNYKLKIANSIFNLDGIIFSNSSINSKKDGINFTLSAQNAQVFEIEKVFLFFMKQKQKDKNFIENFYDFKGLADIDLNFRLNFHLKNKKGAIFGLVKLKDFQFKSVKLSVPFSYKEACFYFKDDNVTMITNGLLGQEKLYTDFYAYKIFDSSRLIKGKMVSSIAQNFASNYLPDTKIIGRIPLRVEYFIQYHKPMVRYFADIAKFNDIYYKQLHLALINHNRKIEAQTIKIKEHLYLKNYTYLINDKNFREVVFKGCGEFLRKNSKLHLTFVNLKTNEWITTDILGFISDIIPKGLFRGNVTLFGNNGNKKIKNKLTGNFDIINSNFHGYNIEKANIQANKANIYLKAKGTYLNQPYLAYIDMKNELDNNITVNYMDLYLKEYEIIKKASSKKSEKPAKKRRYTIKKAILRLDKLKFKYIVLEKLRLDGFIKNNIAYFALNDIQFADGFLSAKGRYNINYLSSDIDFKADNVDANKASNMILKIQNQFDGKLRASANLKTFNNFDKISAKVNYYIKDGMLKKSEMMIFYLRAPSRKVIKKVSLTIF